MTHFPYVLGLDLGANSLGWSVVRLKGDRPAAIEKMGVRCFDAGVEGNIEAGKDSSRAAARRMRRLPRRQLWRRARRLRKLLVVLQRCGLMPAGDTRTPAARHQYLLELDCQLRGQYLQPSNHVDAQLLPYRLRALAVAGPLPRYAFGRALYHLAQRRGYNSGFKGIAKSQEDEDLGVVKRDISELEAKLEGRTLGQYLASLDPHQRTLRRRWTSRQMYQQEFERMWQVQAQQNLTLTPALRAEIYHAIFYQRPLKSAKGLVGHCSLEARKRRAALALPIVQECRLLQAVNHLAVRLPGQASIALTASQRTMLLEKLTNEGDVTFAALRKLLNLPKAKFNLEDGGEKRLVGHRTNARLAPIFGSERWFAMGQDAQTSIVRDVLAYQKRDALIRRAQRAWQLDRVQAEALADVTLEPSYARHSESALRRLHPYLLEGVPYMQAVEQAYPGHRGTSQVHDFLPPVLLAKPDLRNPAVMRALTETRKVINAIIEKYGRPTYIHIELARELKRSRKDRLLTIDRMRKQEDRRRKALERVLSGFPNYQPRRGYDPAIEKVLLAEECNWHCPYTGRAITLETLLGTSPEFDVEHIYPRRYLDNSFANKTLCYHEENRHRKRDQLPATAYAGEPQRFEDILARVRSFQGPAARLKLERFLTTEVPADFVDRQLNDTRYNTVAAAEYLALLYGGRVDAEGKLRVRTLSGAHTAYLRGQWRLNQILGGADRKSRADHRHHAIDAAVIALVQPGTVASLQRAAEEAGRLGLARDFAPIEPPWPTLADEVRGACEEITVSHRYSRKVTGRFHADTIYSPPKSKPLGQNKSHVRVELHKLKARNIADESIVDPVIRQLVRAKYHELGGGDPAKVFADPANHPHLTAKDGRQIPIHKVRVVVGDNTERIGAPDSPPRHVTSAGGTNHHIVILASNSDEENEQVWRYKVNTRLKVAQQIAAARQNTPTKWEELFRQEEGPLSVKFTLVINECVQMLDANKQMQIYRVVNISEKEIQFQLHSDARDSATLKQQKERVRKGAQALRQANARKVHVSVLGDVRFQDMG